jgi:hypothetical protein
VIRRTSHCGCSRALSRGIAAPADLQTKPDASSHGRSRCVAPEGRAGLLPIPRCSREHDSVAHLQTSRVQAMAECFGPPQSARKDALGTFYPSLEPVDSSTPRSAALSRCALLRHLSYVRAVCVDAHVRICAGCALKAHGVQFPEMETAAKPSSQPRTESCVMSGNGHCEAETGRL